MEKHFKIKIFYRYARCAFVAFILIVWNAQNVQADYKAGVQAYKSQNYAKAYSEWLPVAKQGHPRAQYGLGLILWYGKGFEKKPKEAQQWFELAAKRGYGNAQYALGRSYLEQATTKQDRAKGRAWISRAADVGVAQAQFTMGQLYLKGDGVPKDRFKALRFFAMAANQGHIKAKLNKKKLTQVFTLKRGLSSGSPKKVACIDMHATLPKKKLNLSSKTRLFNRCLDKTSTTKNCASYMNALQAVFLVHQAYIKTYKTNCS